MTLSRLCDPFTFVPVKTHHKCYLPKTLPIWSQLTNIYEGKNSYQKQLFYSEGTKENLEFNCHEPRKKKTSLKGLSISKSYFQEGYEGKCEMTGAFPSPLM